MITNQTKRSRILFTEGTSLSARQSLYALAHQDADERPIIDVLDPAPLCQCRFSGLIRKWVRCPHYAKDPEAFLEFLVHQIQDGDYDVLLPTHEQVYLLSRFEDLISPHVGLALPQFDSMDRLQNKADFMQLLAELDLPHPRSSLVTTREQLESVCEFPCYIKLGHSTAGSGVFRVENKAALQQVADQMDRDGLLDGRCRSIVQQPAVGVQSTVQAVFTRGELVAAHLFEARAIGVGGMSPARVSANHPVVFQHVAEIGRAVQWHGSVFIDYFYDADNDRPEYIEANPRIGETVNASLCGVNLVRCLADVSMGIQLAPSSPTSLAERAATATGKRTQSFYMIAISKAHEGASRVELLRELWAWVSGRGLYRDSEDELTRPREDLWSVLPVFWILAQLFWSPQKSSQRIVRATVENYSVPESAVRRLKAVPRQWFAKLWESKRSMPELPS
ncbi:MAG: hypothetical protein AAF670_01840 [Planctomycetota bacterium]